MSKEHIVNMVLTHPSDIWSAKLDMVQLATQFHMAVYRDTGINLSDSEIESEIFDVAASKTNQDTPGIAETGMFVSPSMVFLLAADWFALLGERLGHPPSDDGDAMYWVPNYPNIRELNRALIRISLKVTRAASGAYREQHGHEMLESFVESQRTGESQEQTSTRLAHSRVGLRRVK